MSDTLVVCDGCWKRGYCQNPVLCRCPCDAGANWKHAEQLRDEREKVNA